MRMLPVLCTGLNKITTPHTYFTIILKYWPDHIKKSKNLVFYLMLFSKMIKCRI